MPLFLSLGHTPRKRPCSCTAQKMDSWCSAGRRMPKRSCARPGSCWPPSGTSVLPSLPYLKHAWFSSLGACPRARNARSHSRQGLERECRWCDEPAKMQAARKACSSNPSPWLLGASLHLVTNCLGGVPEYTQTAGKCKLLVRHTCPRGLASGTAPQQRGVRGHWHDRDTPNPFASARHGNQSFLAATQPKVRGPPVACGPLQEWSRQQRPGDSSNQRPLV